MTYGAPSSVKPAWLFSRPVDLAAFLGSFLFSMAALGVGALAGVLHSDTPSWAWVPAVVLCDVAHVWATAFRTYLDPKERAARARLFAIAPLVGLAVSIALYAVGAAVFWRALAYLAIFHFVRQQYGWVALYRARAGETDRVGRVIDTAAIYAATIYPLLYWHTHLPRRFAWFVMGDIVSLPIAFLPAAKAVWIVALGAYAVRAVQARIARGGNPGKDLVVATTAIAWYVGIVVFDSDYAFTVTNVFMHGIPYFVLVRAQTEKSAAQGTIATRLSKSIVAFVGVLWLVAFFEELLWDRAVWHDRSWLFGDGWDVADGAKLLVVPLLALPQLTHYVLDGFIWRRRSNPALASLAAPSAPPQVTLSTSSP
jgi:hypothetical protein